LINSYREPKARLRIEPSYFITRMIAEGRADNSALELAVLLAITTMVRVNRAVSDMASSLVDKRLNKVLTRPPYRISEEAAALHQELFVVDLHADPLLWNRDLLQQHTYGQVDLPRMVAGNLAFQVFGIVTQFPFGFDLERNPTWFPDLITPLSILQGWPLHTWISRFERALFQARKLARIEQFAKGKFILVRNTGDLDLLVETHAHDHQVVGGFAMLEGAYCLEGDLEKLDRLCSAGVRVIGLAHFTDSPAAGSSRGLRKGGLTPFGRKLVEKAQRDHLLIDLAHSSPQAIDEVLEISNGPVIASHTGVRGTHDNSRNLSDEQVRRIAATGGVIGIAMFDMAVGASSVKATARAIRYVADLAGVESAAVGCDMDGAITCPIDVSGLPLLTEALLDQGFEAREIAQIMGRNALRVIRSALPRV